MSNTKQTKREARLAGLQAYIELIYDEGEALRYDLLSRKVQTLEQGRWRDITDFDINTIAVDYARETGQNVSPQDVNTILHSDFVQKVHPLREWLGKCPKYEPDKMPDWIDELAGQVKPHPASPHGEENPLMGRGQGEVLWQRCFKKWFVGMVAGWMSDEVVNHQVLVLIGKQGIYKTTWLEHIIPPELRQYSCKMASSRELSKDDRIRVAEFGLISLDEIDAMSPRELNVLKSVITTTDVNERAAYGYTKERRIRCASFCASGNNRQFLTDDTGNRRWLPFEIESIENPWNRLEMWPYIYGQAKYLVEMGFPYWFDMDENEKMEEHKKEFEMPHNEEELLMAYFRPAIRNEGGAKFLSAGEIHGRLKHWGSIEKPMPLNKFGELLKRKGFTMYRSNGRTGYIVAEIETQRNQLQLAKDCFQSAQEQCK